MFRCIFEPREEVERLAKLPTVVQAPGDGRQIFQADADMARLFLEDGTALILSQSPPRLRLANGISAARVASGRESPCWPATRASTSERLV